MDKSYKIRKEEFVSNLSGGPLHEIILVTLVAPAGVLLWSTLQSRLSFFTPYRPVAFVTDFLLNIGAILLAITAYSSHPSLLNVLLISPAILITLSARPRRSRKSKSRLPQAPTTAEASRPATNQLPNRPFLTTYRGSMMVITCLAILAVDFKIFPRRFAKVENWGTSLMDMGVGSFVFSAGLVSARAILTKQTTQGNAKPFIQRLISSIRHSIPLLILGLIRLYSVKGLDYAEHVTEYGVHWNFFFTLGFLPPSVEIFDSIATTLIPSYDALAILLVIAYECVLNFTDLKAYILISPRGDSLLSKNREGIFSFIGYLAIFLAGRGTGLVVIPETPLLNRSKSTITNDTSTPATRRRALLESLLTRIINWWLIYFITSLPHIFIPPLPSFLADKGIPMLDLGLGLSVSRRLANLPYVIWVIAFNTLQIFLFCSIETYYFPPSSSDPASDNTGTTQKAKPSPFHNQAATPLILTAMNRNGLAIFLFANLLTGAVNLFVPTLDTVPVMAMGILIAYAMVIAGSAMGLERMGWKIKL